MNQSTQLNRALFKVKKNDENVALLISILKYDDI